MGKFGGYHPHHVEALGATAINGWGGQGLRASKFSPQFNRKRLFHFSVDANACALKERKVNMQDRIASHLTTFIREPSWVSPTRGMEFHKYSEEEKKKFQEEPESLLQMRKNYEEGMARIFPIMIQNSVTQTAGRAYMREEMIAKIGDKELANKLIPDFALGCRRLTVSSSCDEPRSDPNLCHVPELTFRLTDSPAQTISRA